MVFATLEYLQDHFHRRDINEADLDRWLDEIVIKKWLVLEDSILNQDVHYDIYATTKEGEAKGLSSAADGEAKGLLDVVGVGVTTIGETGEVMMGVFAVFFPPKPPGIFP